MRQTDNLTEKTVILRNYMHSAFDYDYDKVFAASRGKVAIEKWVAPSETTITLGKGTCADLTALSMDLGSLGGIPADKIFTFSAFLGLTVTSANSLL